MEGEWPDVSIDLTESCQKQVSIFLYMCVAEQNYCFKYVMCRDPEKVVRHWFASKTNSASIAQESITAELPSLLQSMKISSWREVCASCFKTQKSNVCSRNHGIILNKYIARMLLTFCCSASLRFYARSINRVSNLRRATNWRCLSSNKATVAEGQ